jgi:hypothetical protein
MPMPKAMRNRSKQLPGIEPLCCPACDKPVTVLGQWSPHSEKWWLCKECSIQYRYPLEMMKLSPEGEWDFVEGVTQEQLNYRAEMWIEVETITTKRKKIRKGVMKSLEHLMVKQLAFIKDLPEDLQLNWERQLRTIGQWKESARVFLLEAKQISMPFCERCGEVHTHQYNEKIGGFKPQCRYCDAKTSVETFWRLRKIFEGQDDETILDGIEKSHPHLFQLGVLPDYWFELKRGQS